MTCVTFQGERYALEGQETILECLLRHGVAIPNGCRSGVCQSCLMKAVSGSVPATAQSALKPQWREQQYFLACVCRPVQDLEIMLADEMTAPHIEAEVLSKERLNDNIVRLRLRCQQPFSYRAGQFIHLQQGGDNTLIRSYSLASVPGLDQMLEIHVQHIPGGRMSGWLHRQCQPGQLLLLSDPLGECYYLPGEEEQGLLLLATGTGLAPLWGVLRDALEQGHRGPIRLFHGVRTAEDLYLVDELQALTSEHEQLAYFPCLDGEGAVAPSSNFQAGRVQDLALQYQANLQGWRVYLCGNPAMVNEAKRKVFLAGAALAEIHADPFVSSVTD